VGYPAWNLLYYTLFCSLPPDENALEQRPAPVKDEVVVIETGTNHGCSSIVMAQALKDAGVNACLQTVDVSEEVVEIARNNVKLAGLEDQVRFHVEDSLPFLSSVVDREPGIDFILIDDDHSCEHVIEEFSIVLPSVMARQGTVYFDNTSSDGVAEALRHIQRRHGGNFVRFQNCSWWPPGNVIWQPDEADQ
jgi:predicted O-methyltransferase YrrM